MTPLTICCLLVKGEYPYTPDYVRRLKIMVDRFCSRPFRFACLTDQPGEMPAGVEAIPITKCDGCFAFWNKLRLFDLRLGFTGRMLYIDLDSLVVAPLDQIIDFPGELALTEDAFVVERAHLNKDRYGRTLVRRFNSSVMVWDGGTQTDLFSDWTLAEAKHYSTDQDWIGAKALQANSLPLEWFPRASRVQPPWPVEAKVVLAKKPKGEAAVAKWPWFNEAWGGWAA